MGTAQKEVKSAFPLPAAIAAVVILLAFIGWLAYRNFGPTPVPPLPPPNANEIRMQKIYAQSGGDLSKLNPADMQWLHEYSGGHEQQAFGWLKKNGGGRH